MLVKMAEVLVKMSVMMMAPGSVPAPPEARDTMFTQVRALSMEVKPYFLLD